MCSFFKKNINFPVSSQMYDWAADEPGQGDCVKYVSDSYLRGWSTTSCILKNTVVCLNSRF